MVKFHVPGLPGFGERSNLLDTEFQAMAQAYQACGYELPAEATQASLLAGIGWAFTPDQLAPVAMLSGLSDTTKSEFASKIQPELKSRAQRSDEQVLALAHQVGRVIAADTVTGRLLTPKTSIQFGADTIHLDGHDLPYSVDSGQIVEFGMGINGLLGHLDNAKAGRYAVTAIQKTLGETMLLRGIISFFKLNADRVTVLDGGIAKRVGERLNNQQTDADVVVASRVHAAGTDLSYGITRSDRLLRSDGQLIARGPRAYRLGMGYDQVLAKVNANKRLRVTTNQQFTNRSHSGKTETTRLIVARKI